MKKINFLFSLFFLSFPIFAYAEISNVQDFLKAVFRLIHFYIVPLVGALGLLAFIWGLVKFIFYAGNEDKIIEGRRLMTWGIIALFVMTSVFGLVTFLQNAFGFQNNSYQYNNGVDTPIKNENILLPQGPQAT